MLPSLPPEHIRATFSEHAPKRRTALMWLCVVALIGVMMLVLLGIVAVVGANEY